VRWNTTKANADHHETLRAYENKLVHESVAGALDGLAG
jgi:hypothetical protein